jgi:hypothetical protein
MRVIHNGFPHHSCFSVKKADKNANFTADGIISSGTHHNSLFRDKNKHYMASYMVVYKAMSHVTLPRMRELSLAPTLVA